MHESVEHPSTSRPEHAVRVGVAAPLLAVAASLARNGVGLWRVAGGEGAQRNARLEAEQRALMHARVDALGRRLAAADLGRARRTA